MKRFIQGQDRKQSTLFPESLEEYIELGTCSSKQIAALVGVAPFNDDSRRLKGYRRTGGGRKINPQLYYISSL